ARRFVGICRAIPERKARKAASIPCDYQPVLADDPHPQQLAVECGERTKTLLRAGEHDVADDCLHGTVVSVTRPTLARVEEGSRVERNPLHGAYGTRGLPQHAGRMYLRGPGGQWSLFFVAGESGITKRALTSLGPLFDIAA